MYSSNHKLDQSAIMREAWSSYHEYNRGLPFCRTAFGRELKAAWAKAKLAAFHECPINRTRSAINAIESKPRLTQQDYARLGVLRAALQAQQERLQPPSAAAEIQTPELQRAA